MKNRIIFTTCTSIVLLLSACGEETKENNSKGLGNPVDTYMDSRVNAIDMAKQSVKDNNKRVKEQDKALETLRKP